MPTLCAAPLWGPELDGDPRLFTRSAKTGDEPLPFEESMLKQHGEEIQCIPFTTSPFAVLDIARNLSWSNAIINENLKFSPSSLKVNMVSLLRNFIWCQTPESIVVVVLSLSCPSSVIYRYV